MHLLLYTHEYPPFRGGAGTYSRDLAEAAAILGTKVSVLTNSHASVDSAVDPPSIVRCYRYPGSDAATWSKRVASVICREQPDLLLVTERGAIESLALVRTRLPRYAVTLHGTEAWWYWDQTRRRATRRVASKVKRFLLGASAIICVSEATARLVRKYLPAAAPLIHVIPNGIDVERCQRRPTTEGAAAQRVKRTSRYAIATVGRIDTDKGQDTTLRAFRTLLDSGIDAELLIAGDGPDRPKMELLAQELDVSSQTRFLGLVDDRTIREVFHACDVFVLPSRCQNRWEGFGLVFLEANIAGKPVIGGAVGGVPEAIEDGVSGLLVDPNSADEVAQAMLRLLRDPHLATKLGRDGCERVKNRFTSQRMAQETIDVLRGIHGNDRLRSVRRWLAAELSTLDGRVLDAMETARWLAGGVKRRGLRPLQWVFMAMRKALT